jgi:hypothetical protein
MDLSAATLDTEVLDLTDVSMNDLRHLSVPGWDHAADRLIRQAQRPRTNFGGTGPPGRAD